MHGDSRHGTTVLESTRCLGDSRHDPARGVPIVVHSCYAPLPENGVAPTNCMVKGERPQHASLDQPEMVPEMAEQILDGHSGRISSF